MNVLACGALARELIALKQMNHWEELNIKCLPAHYHQTPQFIPEAVRAAIAEIRVQSDEPILVAYGDCGTAGKLDEVLAQAGVERLPGAHCYEFFAGTEAFDGMQEEEIGTFYLTDFLVRHFDSYVMKTLGLDRKPELKDLYFANYRRLMYLAQTHSPELLELAKTHAWTLGLEFACEYTSYGELEKGVQATMPVKVVQTCPN